MLLVKANFSLFSYSVFLVLEINLWKLKTENWKHNLNKFWVGMFRRQGHINQVFLMAVSVSQLVSYWQALPMIGLGSDKNEWKLRKKKIYPNWWRICFAHQESLCCHPQYLSCLLLFAGICGIYVSLIRRKHIWYTQKRPDELMASGYELMEGAD